VARFSSFLDRIHAMPHFNDLTNPNNLQSPVKEIIQTVLSFQKTEEKVNLRINNLKDFLLTGYFENLLKSGSNYKTQMRTMQVMNPNTNPNSQLAAVAQNIHSYHNPQSMVPRLNGQPSDVQRISGVSLPGAYNPNAGYPSSAY